ncbi:MAG: NAD-dependent epimerase/dehydratase family protein [Nitrospirales bacterium]|nr:MAG: NAD-dependent epimerase/dehydratase family protein [Nitrospirales bacterium]
MSHSILLFGATSILGFNLARLFSDAVIPFTSPGNTAPAVQQWPVLNLEDPVWVEAIFDLHQPQILLYCHAVCDVPKCEANPDWAKEVNLRHLQRVLHALPQKTRMVYVSSDHVFGGDGTYDEQSPPCPISVYGSTRVEAEHLVLERPQSLIIRTGLAIGPSPNGRTGHLDWIRYRTQRRLPITIVEDEYRSVVWVEDLARRVMKLARTRETGIRHIPATRAIARIELAHYLLEQLGLEARFHCESRHNRPAPHLGRVELISAYRDEWADPLLSVVDSGETSRLGEVA